MSNQHNRTSPYPPKSDEIEQFKKKQVDLFNQSQTAHYRRWVENRPIKRRRPANSEDFPSDSHPQVKYYRTLETLREEQRQKDLFENGAKSNQSRDH